MAVNRLTLQIGVQFNKSELTKQTKLAQKQLDKAFSDNIKKQQKLQDSLANKTKTANKNIKEQATLFGKVTGALKKTALTVLKLAVVAGTFKLITDTIRQAIGLAFELDTAFTNFSIVSKATASELANVNEQVDRLSLELGKLKKEVIDTVTEFSRAGFSIAESLTLAENAIQGANVGATDLANVTTFLIAGLKSFDLEAEESARILDVLFRVANTTAINLEGIGEAFLRSANTLNTAGASLEESAALIAGANESIQDPAKVGTALKTIASRLRGVSEDGEAIPKLAESFNAVGISIQEADGSFRNIFDIFQDLARILPELDELTRESLLEKLAGKRQKNIIIGLLNNFDTAEQALKDALNSTGEVAEANEKFLESLQGRTNQLREAWNQLLTTFTDSDALKDIVTSLKNIIVFLNQIITVTPKAIFLLSGLALVFLPFGTIPAVLGAIVASVTALGIASNTTSKEINRLNERLSAYNNEISELDERIANLKATEDRTQAQDEYLSLLEEELLLKKQLKEDVGLEIAQKSIKSLADAQEGYNDRLKESKDFIEGFGRESGRTQAILSDNLSFFQKTEKELKAQKLAILELLPSLDENGRAYEKNSNQLEEIDKLLSEISNTYKNVYGFAVEESTKIVEESNRAIIEQISLFKEVKNLVSTASDDYQVLSDALEQLEIDGYLTDDMLNTLIETYPDLISQTGLAKDAFRDYVDSNKLKTIEEINRLKTLAQAEIDSAIARIEALKAVSKANQTFSLVSAFKEAELSIQNAKNNIALLENERKQILATETARRKSISSSTREADVLSDLELKLKNLNFQIDLQQKLLERTSDEEKQIELNNELVDLYEQLRQALIEQQKELDEQGKSLKKGTEEYDDYIEDSFKLSLAIEDASNNIVKFTNANKELNKAIEEGKIEDLADDLEKISEKINEAIQEQIDKQRELAKASEEYYDDLISSKEEELQALKDANDEREKQVELEELLQNLQDLRERRANILANKSARIVKDAEVGFEFIADPNEIKQVNEDILNTEKAIDEFRREQKFEEDVKRLETTIANLEAEAKAEQESFDVRIEELENYQGEINSVIENGGEITQQTVETIQQALLDEEVSSYGIRLEELQGFVNEYNNKIAQLNAQKATVDALNSSIKATEASIERSRQNIASASITSSDTTTTGSTPTSSNTGRQISGNGSSTNNSNTVVQKMEVSYEGKDLDELLRDTQGKMHTML